MERTTVNGTELAYRIAGPAEGPAISMIHGYTGNTRNWALTIRPLTAAGWRTLTADNPGHGDSAAPEDLSAYTMENMADAQHGLARSLGFAPAVVAGHSMGGAIAEEYAIRHPEAVRALVLVDSAGGGPREVPGWAEQRAMMAKGHAYAREHGLEAFWEYQVANGLRPGFSDLTPEMQALAKSEFLRTSLRGYLECGAQLGARRHTLEDLAKLTIPTLVIRGENEGPGLVQVADDLARVIPGARLEVIPGAGHSPQFEAPERFNAVLLDFLASLPRD